MLPDLTNMLSWWQWAILGAVPPAIITLYFLKLKRRPLEVPSTYLWHKSIEDLHVNSIWQRLRRNLLLLLQLLVLLAVILAVLRPHWQAMRISGSRFIFLVDNSASMQATDVKPTRLEEAKHRVAEVIDQMRSGDAAMLISFSDGARVEQNFTNDRQRLRGALASIKPSLRSTNLSEALKLAAGLVNPTQVSDKSTDAQVAGTKLFIFSDGRFPAVSDFELGNLEPVFVPIGTDGPANVAVVAFSIGRHEEKAGQMQAFARLANYGPQPASVLVKLFLDDKPEAINADRLEIPADDSRGVAFDLSGIESGVLHIKVETGDQLAADDEAWAVLDPPRRCRVLLVTPGNERLQQALTTKAAADLAELKTVAPDFLATKPYLDGADTGGWDLVIFDRAAPKRMPRANTFFIGSLPPDGWSAKPTVFNPQIIDAEVSHRLMQWVDLAEIRYVLDGRPLKAPSGNTVLVDSDAGPLLALAPREGFEDLVLGFSLIDERTGPDGKSGLYPNTNWTSRPSFASFMLNLLSYMGSGHDALNMGGFRPGSTVTIDATDPQAAAEVRLPSGDKMKVSPTPAGKLSFAATDELGVYRIRSNGKTVHTFAVNMADPAESNIRPPANPSIKIGYVEVSGATGWRAGRRDIWRELVLIGLVVSVVEWYIYMRRIY